MQTIKKPIQDPSYEVMETLKAQPNHLITKLIAFAIIAFLTIWSYQAIEFNGINEAGLRVVGNIMKYLIWPDTNPDNPVIAKYLLSFESYAIPYLLFETLMIAFIGTLLGAILSLPLAFLSSKNIVGAKYAIIGTTFITFVRTIPIFIYGLIFIRVQGGALAGVLAIAVTSIGMISKMFIEIIEDLDKGILEALDSTGATLLQKIRFGIIPQLSASFLSISIYRFEINIKNATILGMVGAGGIGFTLIDALGSFNFGIVAACLWGIIPLVLIIEYISTKLRARLAIKQ